ncbi:calcium-binding protein [Actinoplanes sp. NPDC049118]|uniref:calcium-binding protein n=1 Tax=Actinoplanes sp. NPDC049118 TaxID=3155769 RepID=UPI00340ACDF7
MSRPQWLAGVGLALLATVSIGALAAPAQAAGTGKAYVQSGGKVWYKAATGKTNKVVITLSGNTVTIDDRVAIKAGTGCKKVKGDKTKVRCTAKAKLVSVRVYLRDGNDTLVNKSKLTAAADGGSGKDTLTGGPGRDTLWGGAGADVLRGLGGIDFIHGDVSNAGATGGDIRTEGGNDVIYGGDGNDYIEANAGTNKVYGEAGNDEIHGSDRADILSGGSGNDSFWDYGGDDKIYGGTGNDTLRGGPGNDHLYGDAGNDTLLGERGTDKLYGGTGDDELSGADADTTGAADHLDGGANGTAGDGCAVLENDVAVNCER